MGARIPLRVVLATTHIAAARRPGRRDRGGHRALLFDVTRDGLVDWFGVESPRIALCALNPHAGDGGRFGTEDDTILRAGRASRRASPGRFPRTRYSCARSAVSSTP